MLGIKVPLLILQYQTSPGRRLRSRPFQKLYDGPGRESSIRRYGTKLLANALQTPAFFKEAGVKLRQFSPR